MPHLMRRTLLICCVCAAFSFTACDRNRVADPNPLQTDVSPARSGFAISGNYLFLVNQHALQGYDISASGGVLIKAGSVALHAAADTLYALASGQLVAGLHGKDGLQRFSAAQQPGLLGTYQGWRRGSQLAVSGTDISVLFSRDSLSFFLYDAAAAGSDPSVLEPRDTVISKVGRYVGIMAKGNVVYVSSVTRLTAYTISNHHYTQVANIDLQTSNGEQVEDISLAGNELVLRSNKQLFFFDLTTPQVPALLAKLTR